jgi:TolB-like protein/Flp pilus assembly protein TadD
VSGGIGVVEGDGEGQTTGAQSATPDVFVSYASQDAAVGNAIVEILERHGVRCWIAPRDVTPGSHYADGIMSAISGARALVLVLSGNALASKHVGKEVERASSKGRPIIALRTDAAPLTPAFEYFLSESQWLDVGVGGVAAVATKLVEAVRSHADSVAATGQVVAPPIAGHPKPPPLRQWGFPAVAVVVAVLLGYFVVDKLWLSKHAASVNPVAASTPASTPAAPAISEKSIAVLPFTDMSEKKDQEYFGDGMAEEILDLLAKVPGLTVIGRTSSFQFKGKNEDLRTIGTKLNAAYVLEGSVRNSGDQVRITAQLINTRTGAHEWSETYNRPIGDVLKLQDAIAAAVVRELQLTVTPGDLNTRATVKNAEAYDLYLRGRHAADRWDQEGFAEAVSLYHQALDRDPTFVEAATWLAWAYTFQGEEGFLAPAFAFEEAHRAAATAIQLDPKSAQAHNVLGEIYTVYDWDWAAADRELRLAAERSPGSAYLSISEALLSLVLGRWDDALRQIEAAQAQDPLEPSSFSIRSSIQERRGHLSEAEAAMRRALDIRPNYAYGHYNLGLLSLERGDRGGALREMQQESIDDRRQQGLAVVYYALGRKTEGDAALAGMLKNQANGNALGIAEVYAFRGQADEAMHWLERAYGQKDPYLHVIKSQWLLKNLVADPRYKAFLKKMNLPE